LILDQKVDRSKPNFGILTLPNLETKFISANTLIGLEKSLQRSLRNPEIERLEQELKFLRHRYFRIKSRAEKIQLQNEDRELREKLKKALIGDGWNNEVAEKIVKFDIFDQNASTDWFDPEWMFGVNDGFDIVIGNPPYVRQENIENKDLIIESISRCFIDKNGKSLIKINKRSDLYIYFYYKGLELLKKGGIFSFINSNSWLDVEFGAELQEFLLKNMNTLMIVDNLVERSFEADINTVIVFIQKPINKITDADLIKFVVFKEPYDKIINSPVVEQVRKTNVKTINDKFRLIVKTRKELWIEGIETEDDELNESRLWSYPYIGNKWGGKYLRAPEIFFKILEKGKDKLVRLGDIAEVRFGIKTGANEFFYLEPIEKSSNGLLYVKNSAGWEGFIEEEFLKPVIKSPRELKTILVREEVLKYKVFMCHKSKEQLKGTFSLKYIEWGEKQGYHKRPTCALRPRWWDLGEQNPKGYLWSRLHNESHKISLTSFYAADTFSIIYPNFDYNIAGILFNNTLTWFLKELLGRKSLGEGGLSSLGVDLVKIIIVNPNFLLGGNMSTFEAISIRPILSVFEELGFQKCTQRKCNHPEHPYEYVKPEEVSFDRIMPDRRELDKIIFEAIGLTEEEQLEVYRAVLELVKNRLLKAKSK
jgi:hypothetical protein